MDLEKTYDRVDREALECAENLWYGWAAIKGGYRLFIEANAYVGVGGKFSENFTVEVGVRQGCVMSPWLFNIFMDGCMKEMKYRVGNESIHDARRLMPPFVAPYCTLQRK